jgi:hypothetical protein
MIKEALEFLAGIQTPKNPQVVLVHDQPFIVNQNGTLGEAVRPVDVSWPKQGLVVGTLSGLVDAYKAKVGDLGDKVALHIQSHLQVSLVNVNLDAYGKRREYARAVHAEDTAFEFGKFYEPEKFIIAFRAGFYFNEEAVKVQQLCSTIASGSAVAVNDDGISQEVIVKSGTLTEAGITLPADGIPLIPWRTFRDANPVESRFLLRMRGVKDGLPLIAIFEIDARWKLDHVASIRSYLHGELPDATIIA